ncbi:hypothetical protein AMTRI_Chr11g93430 [Amborella trichopoda]|uniref:Ubiquitin thioesterase OTU n=1 Tax=Amborella trichopoda TaxID=13333 RepID=W1PYV9_AMBTC|nr:uncharacterized protein LOC18441419 [Amborella trichopoda]ERN13181.1 hypothetical protein AMTR_s00040p00212010 [Amborella trichopoda]|eukprot:XP_006851714.1 uncharacterized protein LOC18441419 [Amborella trichopoda]
MPLYNQCSPTIFTAQTLMLGSLCSRPKPWILSLSSLYLSPHHRPLSLSSKPIPFSTRSNGVATTANAWQSLLPLVQFSGHFSGQNGRVSGENGVKIGWFPVREEGSWNVAWDLRPARWLQGSNSAWLLFGVRACFNGYCKEEVEGPELELGLGLETEKISLEFSTLPLGLISTGKNIAVPAVKKRTFSDYRVTGVPGDGRCLFRAVAHGACLRNGKAAPNESLQRELADDLRAKVAEEILKRREETEWFIEEDFETYVKSIQQPYVWGGEPELLMASHVLQAPISVFMMDKNLGGLINIANYGQEYGKEKDSPIKVLYHGYGHYDALELFAD